MVQRDGPAFQRLDGSTRAALESGDPSAGPRSHAESARRTLSGQPRGTVIGSGARLEGRLTAEETIRVYGSVHGELISSETIIIEEGGQVTATLTAAQVLVDGQIDGQVRGNGRVELRPTAQMRGELHTDVLVIQEGAAFEGRASMTAAVAGVDGPARPTELEH